MKLTAPVSYQGAKHRIAAKVVDEILRHSPNQVYDLCCGTGSVAIELVSRGFPADKITMVDAGPWGDFWQLVGDGQFSMETMEFYVSLIPDNKADIPDHFRRLAALPVDDSPYRVYTFLLLQAASFGGKAIYAVDGKWKNLSVRGYWQPTATSKARHAVNPAVPMPETILKRLETLLPAMRGVRGLCGRVEQVQPPPGAVAYIDPPYANTAGYGYTLDVAAYAASLPCVTLVSEGAPLTPSSLLISEPRMKGGINGKRDRTKANYEYLSTFNLAV